MMVLSVHTYKNLSTEQSEGGLRGRAWKRKRFLASSDSRELKAARNLTKLMKLQPSSILQILAARGLIESSAGAHYEHSLRDCS